MQAATIFVEVAGPALRAGDTGFCDARQKIIPLVGCCPVSVSSVSEIATDGQSMDHAFAAHLPTCVH
jgi:hypothetical protein